jgi:hypothetical protein
MKNTFDLTFKAKKVNSVVYAGTLESGTVVSFYIPNELVPQLPRRVTVTIEELTAVA